MSCNSQGNNKAVGSEAALCVVLTMSDYTVAGQAAAAQTRRPHVMRTCPTWSCSLFLLQMYHTLLQSKLLRLALATAGLLDLPSAGNFVKAHD